MVGNGPPFYGALSTVFLFSLKTGPRNEIALAPSGIAAVVQGGPSAGPSPKASVPLDNRQTIARTLDFALAGRRMSREPFAGAPRGRLHGEAGKGHNSIFFQPTRTVFPGRRSPGPRSVHSMHSLSRVSPGGPAFSLSNAPAA